MAKVGRPRKNAIKLPAWFDAKKYEGVKNFDAQQWFEQLEIRFRLNSNLEFYGEPANQKKGNLSFREQFSKTLEKVRQSPIANITALKEDSSWAFIFGGRLFALNGGEDSACAVSPITNSTAIGLYDNLPNELKYLIYQQQWMEILKKPDMYELIHKHAETAHPIACINLDMPDKFLYEEFKLFITEQRKLKGKKAKPIFAKKTDFANWYNCGVLPYLDIRLWEIETSHQMNVPLFVSKLSEILPEAISEGTINKTTKPLAGKLMDEQTLEMLLSQAAREKLGHSKKSGKFQTN